MALEHIPQCTCPVVVARPVFDANGLGCRNLHTVNIVAVPDRLKNGVGEPKHQNVLNGFFAEVVVDAIYLRFVETATDMLV